MSEASALAQRLLRSADRAALGVVLRDAQTNRNAPYVSLVLVSVDHDLSPILLLSQLAEHTKAIAADATVSLLIDGTGGLAQPLTGPRLTLLGRAQRTDVPRLRQRYLAHHPDASRYADFGDFAFYRIAVERAHLVGGFGMIQWLPHDLVTFSAALAEPLCDTEPDILAHMNADHADAIALYATRLAGQPAADWRMVGIDRAGLDLLAGGARARVEFDHPVVTPEAARAALISLGKRARETP